ncbi:MAG: ketopantoate reductase family protein [Candidatus Rokuibacteriota bacterium]
MKVCVVGAGSMGCLYGGLLARAGTAVTLVDVWVEHVEAIRRHGLRLDGVSGDLVVPVAATTELREVEPVDAVFIQVDANTTPAAAQTAVRVLAPDGFAITFQNGIGNVERLVEALGDGRVLGGLSYHSAALRGPGHVTHTHAGPTWIGELDGRPTERLRRLHGVLETAGLRPAIADDVRGRIWSKFVHNSAINALCALTGLRVGEVARCPEADALQTRLIEEVLAVVRAKRITLPDRDPMRSIKELCRVSFNRPSMLQHLEQGRRTEIDALNGAVVREGRALGVPTPYNEAVTWLVKAVEARHEQARRGPVDYDRLEAEARTGASSGS